MGQASFRIELQRREAPAVIWQRLWDLSRHTEATPFTRVQSQHDQPLGAGVRFLARTSLGPLRLDDRMVVRWWQPPHLAVIEKIGPVLFGRIRVEITQTSTGSALVWLQSYSVAKMPDTITKSTATLIRRGYMRSLEKILA